MKTLGIYKKINCVGNTFDSQLVAYINYDTVNVMKLTDDRENLIIITNNEKLEFNTKDYLIGFVGLDYCTDIITFLTKLGNNDLVRGVKNENFKN